MSPTGLSGASGLAGPSAVAGPAERLVLSRERLRLAMAPPVARAGSSGAARNPIGAWFDDLKANPVSAMLIDAVTRWWARHPLRLAGMVAAGATTAVVRPMAQRYPLGLVVAALVIGGLLAWSRPWRWLLTPALLAGFVPRMFSSLMAMVPSQAWMAVLTSLTQPQQPQQQPPANVPVQPTDAATKHE